MRAAILAISVVVGGCSFQAPAGVVPGQDAGQDGPADGHTDGSPGDGPPIDTAPSPARRKVITIDPDQVTGNQTAFPVWIALASDPDLSLRADMDGADLHFTRADGAALPYQLQRWEKATGRLEAWVRVDLADNQPTVLELRYGDPAAAHAPDAPAVFSSSFAAVWHLDDPLTNNTVADATNQRNGTAQGGLNASDQIAAKLGGGIDFDGSNNNNNRIQFTNPFTGGGNHTFSAWVNQRTGAGFDSIVTVGNPVENESRWFHTRYLDGVSAGFFGNDLPGSVGDIANDGWVLLHWTFVGGGARRSRVYLNGAEIDDRQVGPGVNTQGNGGQIGSAPNQWGPGGNTPCALNGTLDEVRLATVERSAGWIATEYANQNSPLTFYAVGPELPVP